MKNKLLIISIFFCIISCTEEVEKTNLNENQKFVEGDNIETSQDQLSWSKIKNNFPNSDILNFDFSFEGELLFDIESLPEVDSTTFNEIVDKVGLYSDLKEYLRIFYYSKNIIGDIEIGIFLTVLEFDGTEYSFDAIRINDDGQVSKHHCFAYSWQAAECFGYERAQISIEEDIIITQKLQKCFDDNPPYDIVVDSSNIETSINSLDFEFIKKTENK